MATSWEQLLGGYATNTLTEEEKRQLFEAVLHDQTLFDALADEEGLKKLLDDPEVRQRILESLRAQEKANQSGQSGGGQRGWFLRPSSLAWAGSIAAMGLALIFGWQMEKEWGSTVQQEQEAAQSQAQDLAQFRTPELKEKRNIADPMLSRDKTSEQPEPTVEQPSTLSTPLIEQEIDGASPDDRIEQLQVPKKREGRSSENVPVASAFKTQEQRSQVSGTALESDQAQSEGMVPPLGLSDAVEEAKPEVAAPTPGTPLAAGSAPMEESGLPPGALDLFYAGLGMKEQSDQIAKTDRDHPLAEKSISELSKLSAREKTRVSAREKMEAAEGVIQKAQGLRYSFIRKTKDGEEELGDERKITGDWRDVRLAIEPNETGYLYVAASLGVGKWQPLDGMMMFEPGNDPSSGKINAYQAVEYRLGTLTNLLGKLVVPSVTVLFSRTPIDNVGPWLSGSMDLAQLKTEVTDHSVYVVRPGTASDAPLRVDITFEE